MADTVRVRVKLLMNAEGRWAAYGYTNALSGDDDDVLFDMMHGTDIDSALSFYLVADVPVPQVAEITARVEETGDE